MNKTSLKTSWTAGYELGTLASRLYSAGEKKLAFQLIHTYFQVQTNAAKRAKLRRRTKKTNAKMAEIHANILVWSFRSALEDL